MGQLALAECSSGGGNRGFLPPLALVLAGRVRFSRGGLPVKIKRKTNCEMNMK